VEQSRFEEVVKGRGRAEQWREKGEAAAKGRGRGRERSSRGRRERRRQRQSSGPRLLLPVALGVWAAATLGDRAATAPGDWAALGQWASEREMGKR
jgi:hypothetical protein